MRRFLIALLVLFVLGGFVAWKSIGAEPKVLVDPALAAQASKAGASAQEITLEDPSAPAPRSLSQVRALLGPDAFAAAEQSLRAFLAAHPESGAARVLLAETLRRRGQLEEALRLAEEGLERLPEKGRAHALRARILAQQMERSVAKGGALAKLKAMKLVAPYRDSLRTAIVLDPTNVDARKEEVLFHLYTPGIGDPKEGLRLAQEIVPIDRLQGELMIARAMHSAGDPEGALEKARQAAEHFPQSTEPLWIEASLRYEAKEYTLADGVLEAIVARPDRDETYYQALYRRMRLRTAQGLESERVLAFADEYLAANPAWEWAPPVYRVLCEKGRALEQLGRTEEARQAFEACLAIEPNFDRAEEGLKSLE